MKLLRLFSLIILSQFGKKEIIGNILLTIMMLIEKVMKKELWNISMPDNNMITKSDFQQRIKQFQDLIDQSNHIVFF
jgi:hypothetical protein